MSAARMAVRALHRTRLRVRSWLPLLAAAMGMLAACASGGGNGTPAQTETAGHGGTTDSTPAGPPITVTGTVHIFAAASLTDVFDAIGEAFTVEHPDVSLRFNFAGSSALATQIEQGAPADVFASANTQQMQRLVDAGLIAGEPRIVATNEPVIIVPDDNPAGVSSPADLAQPGLRLVLALDDVPIGHYAREVIANLGARPEYGEAFADAAVGNVVSSEHDARAVLAKVELGEADAGVVYRTDAAVGGGRVRVIGIPEASNVVTVYPIAVTAEASNPGAAGAFVAFVRGERAQATLAAAGFGTVE